MAKYGSSTVPNLNLDNISKDLPLALFAGKQDQTADLADVHWLRD